MQVCGNLSGSAAMQRARGLLEHEGALASMLLGAEGATVDALRLAVKR